MKRAQAMVMIPAIAFLVANASAQGNGGVLTISAACDGQSTTLTLIAEDQGGTPELVGFDILRRKLGDCSDAGFVRISEQPLSRSYNENFTRELVDDNIESNTMYCYRVVGVDASRVELDTLWPAYFVPDGVFTACSSCGQAPIAHGVLLDGGWTWFVAPCWEACYLAEWVEVSASNPEIDFAAIAAKGGPQLFYGEIGCGTVEGCFLAVERVEPMACTVSVTSRPWGAVKHLFR